MASKRQATVRPPNHKAVIDAILEEELFAKKVTEKATATAEHGKKAIVAGIKKAIDARHSGKMNVQAAKNAVMMLFVGNVLMDYITSVHEIFDKMGPIVEKQLQEIRSFGKPLKELAMISDIDIAAREAEKAGLAPTTGES